MIGGILAGKTYLDLYISFCITLDNPPTVAYSISSPAFTHRGSDVISIKGTSITNINLSALLHTLLYY